MGWREVGPIPVSIRPHGASGLRRAFTSRVAASHWPADGDARGHVDRIGDIPAEFVPPTNIRTLATRTDRAYLDWRYGQRLLGYRVLDAGEGRLIVRLRDRGSARELVVAHVADATPGEVDDAVQRAMRDHDITHAIGIGQLGRPGRWITTTRIGPVLTWRAVNTVAMPPQQNWSLTMGDIELF